MNSDTSKPEYTLQQLIIYFLRLGSIGFGGPVALVGYMRRDLVDIKNWINDEDYKEGLALAQLAPGPLAAQLAIYLGYVHYKIIGATLDGFAFALPLFVVLTIGSLSVSGKLWNIFKFFGKAGTFVFGSGLAIVPFLYGGVVNQYGWLTEQQFVDGVTAAAIGAITGAVVVLGMKSLFDVPTILIAIVTAFVLWKYKKIQEPYVIIVSAIMGLLLKHFLV